MSFFVRQQHDELDAHILHPRLWQGAKPDQQPADHGFDVLVLCAVEHQNSGAYDDIDIILAPNRDNSWVPPTKEELDIAIRAAKRVVEAVQANKQVLVTCIAGLNRSGLVSALALRELLGISGSAAMKAVRYGRPGALFNPWFEQYLEQLP